MSNIELAIEELKDALEVANDRPSIAARCAKRAVILFEKAEAEHEEKRLAGIIAGRRVRAEVPQ
jgi:hypothetical protein